MIEEIQLRIILEHPISNVDFGLQKGSGHLYETTQKQRANAADIVFECSIRIKGTSTENQSPVFSGPFVQGPPDGRFIYVDIGTYAGQENAPCAGRLKIPLRGISWTIMGELIANPDRILQTHVSATTKDGKPAFGTVKPFNGWQLT